LSFSYDREKNGVGARLQAENKVNKYTQHLPSFHFAVVMPMTGVSTSRIRENSPSFFHHSAKRSASYAKAMLTVKQLSVNRQTAQC